jgi:hypothetical protein
MTKGTKRLAAHYNDEFDTWLSFYQQQANLDKFDRTKLPPAKKGNIDIWNDIIAAIADPNAPTNGHALAAQSNTLLPPVHPKHQNLHGRWKWFLQNDLGQTNQNKLADALFAAIKPSANNTYIIFDVVEAGAKDVILTPGSDDGSPIARITIVTTGPMSDVGPHRNDPPPRDKH